MGHIFLFNFMRFLQNCKYFCFTSLDITDYSTIDRKLSCLISSSGWFILACLPFCVYRKKVGKKILCTKLCQIFADFITVTKFSEVSSSIYVDHLVTQLLSLGDVYWLTVYFLLSEKVNRYKKNKYLNFKTLNLFYINWWHFPMKKLNFSQSWRIFSAYFNLKQIIFSKLVFIVFSCNRILWLHTILWKSIL